MKGDFERVMNVHEIICRELDEPEHSVIAAILTACVVAEDITSRMIESWSHELALGIRKGLFGKNAPDSASITDYMDRAGSYPCAGCVSER